MKTVSLLTLAAGVFAASVASAQSGFSEDWSEYSLGTNLLTAPGTPYYSTAGTSAGSATIVELNGQKVMQTVPGGSETAFYVGRSFAGLSGSVLAEVDLRVGSGGAEIFLSDNTNPIAGGAGTLRLRFAAGALPILAFDGAIFGNPSPTVEVGTYTRNTWYRVSILMDIDAANGTLSSYSVSVMDLVTSSIIGTVSGIDFSGSPIAISSISFGSALNASGTTQWGNLSVAPAVPEPSHMAMGMGLLVGALVACRYLRRRR